MCSFPGEGLCIPTLFFFILTLFLVIFLVEMKQIKDLPSEWWSTIKSVENIPSMPLDHTTLLL